MKIGLDMMQVLWDIKKGKITTIDLEQLDLWCLSCSYEHIFGRMGEVPEEIGVISNPPYWNDGTNLASATMITRFSCSDDALKTWSAFKVVLIDKLSWGRVLFDVGDPHFLEWRLLSETPHKVWYLGGWRNRPLTRPEGVEDSMLTELTMRKIKRVEKAHL